MRRVLVVITCAVLTLISVQVAFAHDSGFGLARYTSDGTLDRSFGNAGVVIIRSPQRSFIANALALQSDGKILIAGMSSDVSSGTLQLAVARYAADGTPDEGFGTGGMVTTPIGDGGGQANAVALQTDGLIVVTGTAFAHGASDDEFLVARYTPAGAPDPTFGTAGVATTHVGAEGASASALALAGDGRVIVAGTAFSNGASDDDFAVARYTSAGLLDESFGNRGVVTTDFTSGTNGARASLDRAGAVTMNSDGTVIVAGFTRGERQSFALARYTPNGTLDAAFGDAGKVQVQASEPQVFSVLLQPTGDIVLAGTSAESNGAIPFTLVRLHADGSPDEGFGEGGVAIATIEGSTSGARAVAVQPDGKLIAGGASYGAPSAQGAAEPRSGFALARYNTDGSSDTSFGNSGRTVTPMGDAGATPLSLGIQADGKILAAGLVFFQVPMATASSEFGLPQLVAIAGGVLAIAALGSVLTRQRGKKRGFE